MYMKKRMLLTTVLLLVALLLCACGGEAGTPGSQSLKIGEQKVVLTATELDLSGAALPAWEELEQLAALPELKKLDLRETGISVADFEKLRALLPECEILWLIPVGDGFHAPETESLTLRSLQSEEMEVLSYFTSLKELVLAECPDGALLKELRERLPECALVYSVEVGGEKVSSDAAALTVADLEPEALMEALSLLPQVREVTLTGVLPDREALLELVEAYPGVCFLFEMELFGQKVSTDARELDFSGTAMASTEELESVLPLFPLLEKVILCDCGLPSEELDALWQRNPQVRIVWNVIVGEMDLRTDITTLMPFQHGYLPGKELGNAYCKEMKYLVDLVVLDLGHMHVTDISFVSYMKDLEYLLVCGNGIQDISPLEGLQKLKYVELFANNITDISALASCPALEDVNLCYNKVKDVTPLLELENLQNLWASAVHMPKDQVQLLEETLGDKINLQLYQSRSTGGGWRDLPNYFAQRDLLGMPYFTTP